ncbi:MAG: DUF4912 domain-containing protein [Treponema sp.]|jgi:hypothetical protein|nr:DUF4912 domain-containing protein [Treponema sp.]
MDDPRLRRPLLEGLSTGELIRLADSYGIDIPPGLERVFIIGELLDIALEDEFDAGEDWEGSAGAVLRDVTETAALPKQYNITFIEVMIRDPLWAFVFWEIKSHDRELYKNETGFEGYCLRVIPLDSTKRKGEEQPFTVPVGIDDTAWYLGFPPAEGRYRVELCVLRNGREETIAVSRPCRFPSYLEPPGAKNGAGGNIQAVYRNPLALLSGAADFQVIRSVERHSRAARNGGTFQAG